MRVLLLIFFCLTINALSPNANASLILHYDFNGDVTDKSGNGLDGTITGSPAFVAGEFDQALNINNPIGQTGATEYVSLPNHAALQALSTSSFTWAIKYKTTDVAMTNGRTFGIQNTQTNGGFGGTYNDGIRVTSNAFVIGTNQEMYTDPESESDANAITTDGEYHWVFLVIDRVEKTFEYYVDEHLIVSKIFTDLGSVSFDNISIGRISGLPDFGARFTTVDEVLIYDIALDQNGVEQVNAHNFLPWCRNPGCLYL
ncbi:hypothetical protein SG34_015060 [Thalassomonas viridans]|uniref:LamG-like jellyroll fold domain-containing protein n=1 Tax=Thalassomonas viridans TaxID=137584 RepID=A0AAE9YYI2_9GAMM|nr:hypothetical protein [Thalassomonas viridans]WDE02765.1 hypothetical protein SG34_015060 [Thalassomonas viridans]